MRPLRALPLTIITAPNVQFIFERTLRISACNYGYVEQGFEVEVKTGEKWIEIGGGGIIPEKVLSEAGYNTKKVAGIACGLGLDRITMLKHEIKDIKELWLINNRD